MSLYLQEGHEQKKENMDNHSRFSQIKLLMRHKCRQRRHLLYVGQDVPAIQSNV